MERKKDASIYFRIFRSIGLESGGVLRNGVRG